MNWLKALFGKKSGSEPERASARERPEVAFSRYVESRARGFDNVDRVVRNDEKFELEVFLVDRGGPWNVFLGNLFRETRDLDPEARAEHIERFLNAVVRPSEAGSLSWDDARERLAPVLRREIMLLHAPGGKTLVRPVLPALAVFVVIDLDDHMMFVTSKQLTAWGKSEDEVFAAALNIIKNAPHEVESYGAKGEPIWHIANDDGYESSRLLVPGLLTGLERQHGKLAFAIPDNVSMLFAPIANAAAIVRLQRTAKREFDAAPRSLSPDLYQIDEHGRLSPLQVDREHPVAEALALTRMEFTAGEHEAQKQLLDERFQAAGTKIFVSSVTEAEDSVSGEIYTYGVWGDDLEYLLAKTDYLIIVEGDPDTPEFSHIRVPWDRVMEIAGSALAMTNEFGLPRWQTKRWLTRDELDQLRRVAV